MENKIIKLSLMVKSLGTHIRPSSCKEEMSRSSVDNVEQRGLRKETLNFYAFNLTVCRKFSLYYYILKVCCIISNLTKPEKGLIILIIFKELKAFSVIWVFQLHLCVAIL